MSAIVERMPRRRPARRKPAAVRRFLALILAAAAAVSWARADHFRPLPLDEGAGHTHYRIVDETDTTILTVRTRAEYASLDLRAKDIANRLNQAVDYLHEHGDLYFEIEWRHGQPIVHQVSRDGTVHFMIVVITPGDVVGAGRYEKIRDMLELARNWLDRIETAVEPVGQVAEPEMTRPPQSARTDSEGPPDSGTAISTGIRVRLEPADAAFYLDDALQPPGSAPIPASPGRHTIEAERPGYAPVRREVEVRQGQIVDLEIRLEAEAQESEPR